MKIRVERNGRQYCACQCHWDLSWLQFGGSKIGFGDVDALMLVERANRFLYIETKEREERLSDAQAKALVRLSLIPGNTVWIVRGVSGFPEWIIRTKDGTFKAREPTNRVDLQHRIDVWFKRVEHLDPLPWPQVRKWLSQAIVAQSR